MGVTGVPMEVIGLIEELGISFSIYYYLVTITELKNRNNLTIFLTNVLHIDKLVYVFNRLMIDHLFDYIFCLKDPLRFCSFKKTTNTVQCM